MPAGEGLARLVDASAILSAEQQAFVAIRHAEDTWSLNPAAATVTLTAPDGRSTVCRAHFLGTSAPGPSTWLWGWRNINDFPPAFVALAERVRVAGEEQGVAELTSAELPLRDELPRRLTIAAKTVTGIAAHYSGPIGGGSRAWLLIEHPDLVLPAPTTQATMDAIRAAVETVEIGDHRAAVRSWAGRRGVAVSEAPDGTALRLSLPDGELVVAFDSRGRIGRVETEAPVGLDASAAVHDEPEPSPAEPDSAVVAAPEPEPQAPGDEERGEPEPPTEAPPLGDEHPDSDHDRLLAMFEAQHHPSHPGGEDEAGAEPQPESPMRRFWDFLRGPKP